jgi:hypothetical protein
MKTTFKCKGGFWGYFLVFIMYYFLKEKDQVGFSITMKYFHIRYYTNLMNKQIVEIEIDNEKIKIPKSELNKKKIGVGTKTKLSPCKEYELFIL